MKMKSIVVLVENKKGDFRQVILNKEQQRYVSELIAQLHKGVIKVVRYKLSLYYPDKSEL